ncbi:hypothetical protein Hhel01_04326 [Haloferula helveola]
MIQFADQATASGRREDQIAAILIYQQLVEEWLHVIDYWCHFECALGIFPTEIAYSTPERITFGQLIDRVARLQEFNHKEELLSACRRLNAEVRNKTVHRLLLDNNLDGLPGMTRIARECCEQMTELVQGIQESFFDEFERLANQLAIPDKRQG